jgi:hypothetical protein
MSPTTSIARATQRAVSCHLLSGPVNCSSQAPETEIVAVEGHFMPNEDISEEQANLIIRRGFQMDLEFHAEISDTILPRGNRMSWRRSLV